MIALLAILLGVLGILFGFSRAMTKSLPDARLLGGVLAIAAAIILSTGLISSSILAHGTRHAPKGSKDTSD